jgi:hypothetical protein
MSATDIELRPAALLPHGQQQARSPVDALRGIAQELAALKRYDVGRGRGYVSNKLTLNVPRELLERLDAALAHADQ